MLESIECKKGTATKKKKKQDRKEEKKGRRKYLGEVPSYGDNLGIDEGNEVISEFVPQQIKHPRSHDLLLKPLLGGAITPATVNPINPRVVQVKDESV